MTQFFTLDQSAAATSTASTNTNDSHSTLCDNKSTSYWPVTLVNGRTSWGYLSQHKDSQCRNLRTRRCRQQGQWAKVVPVFRKKYQTNMSSLPTLGVSWVHNIRTAGRIKPCLWSVWVATVLLKIGRLIFQVHIFLKFMAASNGSIPVHSKVRYFWWFSIIRHIGSISTFQNASIQQHNLGFCSFTVTLFSHYTIYFSFSNSLEIQHLSAQHILSKFQQWLLVPIQLLHRFKNVSLKLVYSCKIINRVTTVATPINTQVICGMRKETPSKCDRWVKPSPQTTSAGHWSTSFPLKWFNYTYYQVHVNIT